MDVDGNKSDSIHLEHAGHSKPARVNSDRAGSPSSSKRIRMHPSGTLAQASAAEQSMTPLQAIKTYWRAFAWCM